MMESGARCVPSTQPISTANNIVDDRDEENIQISKWGTSECGRPLELLRDSFQNIS